MWSLLCGKICFSSSVYNAVKIAECNFFFCSVPRTTSNYSEPRFHESFVMNSRQTSVCKSSGFSTLNVVSSEQCTRKHIWRFVSSFLDSCVKIKLRLHANIIHKRNQEKQLRICTIHTKLLENETRNKSKGGWNKQNSNNIHGHKF